MGRFALTVVAFGAVAVAAALATAGKALAEPGISSYFTPKGEFSVDTTQAGAHPTLKLRAVKTPNGCLGGVYWEPFGKCIKSTGNGFWQLFPPYIEQDLKRWTMRFPEGLMADPQATPKCDNPQADLNGVFSCPPGSQIGTVVVKARQCDPGGACPSKDQFSQSGIGGYINNGNPEPGEQGHLYTLIGLGDDQNPGKYTPLTRVDTSIRVVKPGLRVEAVTDQIPDFVYPSGSLTPIQPYDIQMEIWGKTGEQVGHPLLTNATFCSPRSFDHEFQGYAGYAYQDPNGFSIQIGTGSGKTVSSSATYQATGCDAVPYAPQFGMSLSTSKAGEAPAIDTTIGQTDGEQTTGSVTVRFPSKFKINTLTKVTPCPAEQLVADACPASAIVGTGEAQSRLLPSGPLGGQVAIGQTAGVSFPLRLSLKGFVDVSIDGTVALGADGEAIATFSNLPAVPLTSFKMHLDGGRDRGMVLNPDRCGDTAVTASFVSHQGVEATRDVPLHISCGRLSFDASLSTRKARAHPTVSLAARGTGIDRLAFALPRALKVRKARKLRKGKTYGAVDLKLAKGAGTAKLVLESKSKRKLVFAAKAAGVTVAELAFTNHKLAFTNLPPDLVAASVELNGKSQRLLTNPASCSKPLSFSMEATDPEGSRQLASRAIKTRCAKKRKARGHKQRGRRARGR